MIHKTHVVMHHSATQDSRTLSWQAIRRYHLNKGWRDVGYHLGVELVGDRYEALLGRALDEKGAHAYQRGMNHKGIGVVLVGNFDITPPTDEMLGFTARHVAGILRLLTIPVSSVLPHREVAAYKTCPGRLFPWDPFVGLLREHLEEDDPLRGRVLHA